MIWSPAVLRQAAICRFVALDAYGRREGSIHHGASRAMPRKLDPGFADPWDTWVGIAILAAGKHRLLAVAYRIRSDIDRRLSNSRLARVAGDARKMRSHCAAARRLPAGGAIPFRVGRPPSRLRNVRERTEFGTKDELRSIKARLENEFSLNVLSIRLRRRREDLTTNRPAPAAIINHVAGSGTAALASLKVVAIVRLSMFKPE